MTTAAQIEKLNRRSWATVSQRRTVAEDGKVRELTMLESFVNARRQVDPVGNVAWLQDRRGLSR